MKKQPQQTAQTRKKLMDSFWKLYCDDGIDRVTVGAVAKDAGYNRGTFYEYFTDVYDLLDQLEDELLEYQRSLARVAFAGHWGHVAELQKKLVRSLAAKALAVRHVVQNDSEPGIDGVRWQTDGEKMRAALSLTSKGYHARPYRRFLLQDGDKERRINVPTAYDKAMQALYAFSLDPVAESTADKKSFAFRKGRSIYDAHACLCRALEGTGAPEWIVRADVRACYDSLSQEWLLAHIPMDRKVLREFLKAGVAFGGELFPTEVGISQGASLSPILGNMALDGLQAYLYEQLYPNRSPDYGGGDLTRVADDMIITARSRAQAELILELLEQFLAARGLKLNWDKTYISKVSMGFEFLSRWYRREDSVLVVRPSDQAVKRFENSLESFILGHKGSQQTLIERLNRKLNGWGSYHRVTDAFDAFRRIDSCVQALLIKKMRQLHPKRKWNEHVRKDKAEAWSGYAAGIRCRADNWTIRGYGKTYLLCLYEK